MRHCAREVSQGPDTRNKTEIKTEVWLFKNPTELPVGFLDIYNGKISSLMVLFLLEILKLTEPAPERSRALKKWSRAHYESRALEKQSRAHYESRALKKMEQGTLRKPGTEKNRAGHVT